MGPGGPYRFFTKCPSKAEHPKPLPPVLAASPSGLIVRTKTLMQGDAFCNHRYILEG